MSIVTPAWVRDAVFYQVFPDRFARSGRVPPPGDLEAWDAPPTTGGFKGGDLYGVADHLDHIADLGANAIYLNPIFVPALPKLNVRNPETREYLLGAAEHWIRLGADGWRLDVPEDVGDADFWREF